MKNVLKYGCLSVITIFAALGVIGLLIDDDTSTTEDKIVSKKAGSHPKPLLTDSIWATIVPKDFRKEADEFEKTSFFYHPLTPKYINRDWIYPYIGKNGNDVYLRLKLQYEADDWLFIRKVQFLIDGDVVDFSEGIFETDNGGGRIWEWADLPVYESTILLLERISGSRTSKVRYTGNQYHNDREITPREKKVIKETLAVFLESKNYR